MTQVELHGWVGLMTQMKLHGWSYPGGGRLFRKICRRRIDWKKAGSCNVTLARPRSARQFLQPTDSLKTVGPCFRIFDRKRGQGWSLRGRQSRSRAAVGADQSYCGGRGWRPWRQGAGPRQGGVPARTRFPRSGLLLVLIPWRDTLQEVLTIG